MTSADVYGNLGSCGLDIYDYLTFRQGVMASNVL